MSENILVIFGGNTNESEVSVITGVMCANVLKSGGDSVIPVFVGRDEKLYTGDALLNISSFKGEKYDFNGAIIANGGVYTLNKRGRIKKFVKADAAINCCHGGACEGGAVSGLLKIAQIPLASAGIFESALFMDKYLTKLALKALGVPCAEYAYIKSLDDIKSARLPEYPVIVKPVSLGSSIGIAKADDEKELLSAVESALCYDGAVIVEKYLPGRREINCAAYCFGGVRLSECEEVFSDNDILSYEDKYEGGGKSVMPADIPEAVAKKIKNITKTVYEKLNMRGIVRIDYILSGGKVYLSEVNTVPGSLSYYLLSSGFRDFYKVLKEVIAQAKTDFNSSREKRVLKTGILNNLPGGLAKLGIK